MSVVDLSDCAASCFCVLFVLLDREILPDVFAPQSCRYTRRLRDLKKHQQKLLVGPRKCLPTEHQPEKSVVQ